LAKFDHIPDSAERLRCKSVSDLPEFLSVERFYTYVGVGRSTAYDLLRRGEIPHQRFGRRIVIPKSALTAVR
jgi:excisionase family DNA binding protein